MSRDGRWQSFEDVETLFETSMIKYSPIVSPSPPKEGLTKRVRLVKFTAQ